MLSRRGTSVITTVLFLGIILSCAIFFGVSFALDSYESDTSFFDIEKFDKDFCDNKDLAKIITFCDYKLFRRVKNENIIVGYDNFLFEIERNGYNFIDDYLGKAGFTPNELDLLLENINLRKKVYNDLGIEYVVVVVPNSQTVYSEKMPLYFGPISRSTRLSQIKDYIKEKSDINFVDLRGVFSRIKWNRPVYNNTENTINSLGAYYLYKEVFGKLPSSVAEDEALIENYISGFSLHYTDGKSLAKEAGVDSIVKNLTLTIQTDIPYMYESFDEYENIEITHPKAEYKDEFKASSSIMIEYLNEWDKLQISPYFSNTFETVVYKKGYNYNSRIVNDNFVSAVIQVVRECELDTFLDSNITLSYNAGLIETNDPDITSTPLMLGKVDVDSDTVCIAGRAEEGSTLTIQGAGIKNKTMVLYGEQFIIAIPTKAQEKVNILAMSAGKEASEPLQVSIFPNDEAIHTGVIVGENSRLFSYSLFERYTKNKLYSNIELSLIKRSHQSEIEEIQNKTKKETEFLYLVAPSKINVYSSDCVGYTPKDISKLSQFCNALNDCGDITVIDLGLTMNNNKHLGQLYHQTTPEWTELGAYLGYLKLAERIKKDYPGITVNMFEKYDLTRTYKDGGEYISALGFDPIAFSELVPVLSPNFKSNVSIARNEDRTAVYTNNYANPSLPSAIVVCDTYADAMIEFIAEHFEKLVVLNPYQKNIDDVLLTQVKPDYVIKIFGEDNLDYFAG